MISNICKKEKRTLDIFVDNHPYEVDVELEWGSVNGEEIVRLIDYQVIEIRDLYTGEITEIDEVERFIMEQIL